MVKAKNLRLVEQMGYTKRKESEMTEVKNNTHTTQVHRVIHGKLEEARAALADLKKRQREIDLKVEDWNRVVLALERTEATLSAALDAAPTLPPEEVERLHDQALAREIEKELNGEAA